MFKIASGFHYNVFFVFFFIWTASRTISLYIQPSLYLSLSIAHIFHYVPPPSSSTSFFTTSFRLIFGVPAGIFLIRYSNTVHNNGFGFFKGALPIAASYLWLLQLYSSFDRMILIPHFFYCLIISYIVLYWSKQFFGSLLKFNILFLVNSINKNLITFVNQTLNHLNFIKSYLSNTLILITLILSLLGIQKANSVVRTSHTNILNNFISKVYIKYAAYNRSTEVP